MGCSIDLPDAGHTQLPHLSPKRTFERLGSTRLLLRYALTRLLVHLVRLTPAVGLLGLLACHMGPHGRPEPSRCGPQVPGNAQHPVTSRAAALAGDYDLIQVRTQPARGVNYGRLHLAPVDSIARASAVGGAVRDLVGWLEPIEGDSTSRPDASSHDPNHPGAVLAGYHLLLGQAGALDGRTEQLTITAVAPEGFWGWWKAELGWEVKVDTESHRVLPDPAGYFCALRVVQER